MMHNMFSYEKVTRIDTWFVFCVADRFYLLMLPVQKTVFDGEDRNFIIVSSYLDLGCWSYPEADASTRNNPEDVLTNRQLNIYNLIYNCYRFNIQENNLNFQRKDSFINDLDRQNKHLLGVEIAKGFPWFLTRLVIDSHNVSLKIIGVPKLDISIIVKREAFERTR